MTTTHSLSDIEYLPALQSYLDDEGDIRPIDDDPSGFPVVGMTPKYSDFFSGDAEDGVNYEHGSTDVDGPSVHLGQRAIQLLHAVDMYSSASMLQGLIDSNDTIKITVYGGEQLLKQRIARKKKMGTEALRAASGVDAMIGSPIDFTDELSSSYAMQDADDEMVQIRRAFVDTYTGDGIRHMTNASVAEKQQKKKDIESARNNLRKTLARQVK